MAHSAVKEVETDFYQAQPKGYRRRRADLLAVINHSDTSESERNACERRLEAMELAKVPAIGGSQSPRGKYQSKRDPLASFPAHDQRTLNIMRAANMEAGIGSTFPSLSGIRGSGMSLTGPERFAHSNGRGGLKAWSAFFEACANGDNDIGRECALVIMTRKSWRSAGEDSGIGNGGPQIKRLKAAMSEGLKAAALALEALA